MGQHNNTLTENFWRYFNVTLATTDAQKKAVYNIRYNVYCKEFEYEQAHQFTNHEESDAFDPTSLHALITHNASGLPAGCVRLVAPTALEGEDLLPIEKYCGKSLDRDFLEELDSDRGKICEISRLAVDGMFRRRSVEQVTRFGELSDLKCSVHERRTFSLIAMAGFLAAASMTILTQRTNIFAMMEPFLPRILRRSGINFNKAGIEMDYHGLRAPYFITAQSIVNNIRPEIKEFFTEIHSHIAQDYFRQRTFDQKRALQPTTWPHTTEPRMSENHPAQTQFIIRE